tara:strand:- start:163 stop:381 length:219 start_codon:yes stop_codon:yes gene_type:complete
MNLTPEQSASLVRVFERHVRDTDHGDFKNVGFLDWIKRDVIQLDYLDNCLLATVPGMTIGIEVDGYNRKTQP